MEAMCLSRAAGRPATCLVPTDLRIFSSSAAPKARVSNRPLHSDSMATGVFSKTNQRCYTRHTAVRRSFRVRGSQSDDQEASSPNSASSVNGDAAEAARSFLESPRPAAAITDELVKFISANAEVSVMVVVGTNLVREAQRRHGMAPTSVAALGRLLMGTLLLGAMKGVEETVQVTMHGRGPLGQLTAVSSEYGVVKGYAMNPRADPPLNGRGKMDVGGAVGKGVMNVVRTHPSWSTPYTGTVPLVSGEIAEDLANYLAESEQINSAIGLGVAVGKDGLVRAAGGFLVQVLPFCSEETLIQLESNVQSLGAMSDAVQCMGASEIVEQLLRGLEPQPVEETVTPSFGPCDLSDLRPRMMRAVEALGREDIWSLIQERGSVEVRCEFCAEVVNFKEEDLQDILAPAA